MSFTKKIVTTYAKSLFQKASSAQNGKQNIQGSIIKALTSSLQKTIVPNVYIIGEELLLIRSTIISTKKLNEFFKNPTYLEKQKLDVLLSIFPGLTVIMQSFLKVLTERGHLSLIPEIADAYTEILLKFKNSTKVKVVTAGPLSKSYGVLLLATLKKITNSKKVILSVAYDPNLLGGLVLEYNSLSVDASVLNEFNLFINEV